MLRSRSCFINLILYRPLLTQGTETSSAHEIPHSFRSSFLLPVHALEFVQEKEELNFYILSLQNYTAAMWLGISEAKARCSQALPSPTDLFP